MIAQPRQVQSNSCGSVDFLYLFQKDARPRAIMMRFSVVIVVAAVVIIVMRDAFWTVQPWSKCSHALIVMIKALCPVLNLFPILTTADLFRGKKGIAESNRWAIKLLLFIFGVIKLIPWKPAMVSDFEVFDKYAA